MRLLRINARIAQPRLPASRTDPVGANVRIKKAWRKSDAKFKLIREQILEIFNAIPVAQNNAQDEYGYTYDFNATRAATFSEKIQRILDDILLEDTTAGQMWMGVEVEDAYQSGVQQAQGNLAKISSVYAEQRSMADILYSEPYLNRLGIAYASTYSDWQGLSDQGRHQLASVVMEGVALGKAPGAVANDIVQRVGVTESKAKQMAQTEITGALRQARRDEAQEAKALLGLNVGIFWTSALLKTTRSWHASRHGVVYSPEEVADFYSRDGNRYNCHCGNTECIIYDGEPQITDRTKELYATEKEKWQSQHK
jgi:hypothetical protein